MEKLRKIVTLVPNFDLQFFAEGEEGANGNEPAGEKNSSSPAEQKPLVIYGKQSEDLNAENNQNNSGSGNPNKQTEEGEVDYKKEWDKLKNDPKYRAIYDSEVQGFIKDRFKDHKELQGKGVRYDQMFEILSRKYQITDENELLVALQKDVLESEAFEKGIEDPQNYAEVQMLKAENERLRTEHKNEIERQKMNAKIEDWIEQGRKLQEQYPAFNLQNEVNANPKFLQLIEAGIDVKTAYEVSNPNAIQEQKQAIEKQAEQKVVNQIKNRQNRPKEAGLSNNNNQNVITKKSVHELTKEDRAEIRRRVARGERIVF